jgi:choice-of-anchor A domain-containing protein
MRDFNVVSFGDFNDVSGDVEGRLAVGGNLDVMHFSVGAELQTFNGPDADLPYAVVVGGDAAWTDGSIWPDGSNVPYPGNAEGIYVGGTFTAPPYLAARRSGPGSLATWFAGARQCYNTFSQAFANTPDNVVQSIQYGGLLLQCNDAKAARYTVTVPDTTFNTITYYTLDNCNFQASWVINIGGNGPVQFYGGSFPAVTGGLVYNVLGSGRVINVTGTGVTGHILSPWNSISQTASVIKGKVVVGSFLTAVQVNKPVCNKSPPVTVMTAAAQDTPAGSTSLNVISNALIAGDSANVGGTFLTVVSSNNKVLKFNAPLPSAVSAGSFVTTVVNDTTASRATPIPATTPTVKNGGASFEIFAALLVALLAFAL